MGFFLYKSSKKTAGSKSQEHDSIYCHKHKNERARGACAICQHYYCESCLVEEDHHSFCPEHLKTYLAHQWVEVKCIISNPHQPEDGVELFELKNRVWKKNRLPSIISTQYKIIFEGDEIETHMKLMVRRQDQDKFTEQIQKVLQ